MSDEPLEGLLDRLNRGVAGAAAEVVAAYGPYLRMVARRHLPGRLRGKFDSADVVQSVWVHVLHGLRDACWRFRDPDRLRALLVTITRRRLVSRARKHHRVAECEQTAGVEPEDLPAVHQPRPSEVVQADELWGRMLELSPPEHHELLRLRREGLPLAEIAARTGLHEGSVRRSIRQLARRLALQAGQLPASPYAGN
jgi:RNA polymerase sigma-70 factor (ECF subfamily)